MDLTAAGPQHHSPCPITAWSLAISLDRPGSHRGTLLGGACSGDRHMATTARPAPSDHCPSLAPGGEGTGGCPAGRFTEAYAEGRMGHTTTRTKNTQSKASFQGHRFEHTAKGGARVEPPVLWGQGEANRTAPDRLPGACPPASPGGDPKAPARDHDPGPSPGLQAAEWPKHHRAHLQQRPGRPRGQHGDRETSLTPEHQTSHTVA